MQNHRAWLTLALWFSNGIAAHLRNLFVISKFELDGFREDGAASMLMDQGRTDEKGLIEEPYTSLVSSEADERDPPLSPRQALSGQSSVETSMRCATSH
jgi:hypothetical protein